MLKTMDLPECKTFNEQKTIIDSNTSNEHATEDGINLNAEINNKTIITYLHWKFPDREHNEDKKWVSLLLSDLNYAGIKNYNQIEKVVNDNLKWFGSFEKANPPSNSINDSFSDIGALRIILTEKFYP
ncbi:MAG TPA: hypothetical protein VLU95_05215 [Candidatus Acidoferrum sp.]|nr:hypothetical protein [Candidatus Acidoferrum sp.]